MYSRQPILVTLGQSSSSFHSRKYVSSLILKLRYYFETWQYAAMVFWDFKSFSHHKGSELRICDYNTMELRRSAPVCIRICSTSSDLIFVHNAFIRFCIMCNNSLQNVNTTSNILSPGDASLVLQFYTSLRICIQVLVLKSRSIIAM